MDGTTAHGLERILLWGVGPLWILCGMLDAACHRRQRMELSSGTPESVLHLVMLFELGAGVSAALLLELNAAAFSIMYAAVFTHEITMWQDLAYAEFRRRVPWYEQLVHGVQHALPWAGLAALVLLNPGQALAVFGGGASPAEWRPQWKEPPLPTSYLVAFFGAALLVVVLPFVAEFSRCRRSRKKSPAW